MKFDVQIQQNLLQFVMPGLEMGLRAVLDQINKVCAVLGTPGYLVTRGTVDTSEQHQPVSIGRPRKEVAANGIPKYTGGRRRMWTDEQKREIIRQWEALPKASRGEFLANLHIGYSRLIEWRRQFGMMPPAVRKLKTRPKSEREKGASQNDILTWAREHGGFFHKGAFREKHPGLHLRGLGRTVRLKLLKPSGLDQYKLTAKGESA